jgi:hypothetical protein
MHADVECAVHIFVIDVSLVTWHSKYSGLVYHTTLDIKMYAPNIRVQSHEMI